MKWTMVLGSGMVLWALIQLSVIAALVTSILSLAQTLGR